MTAKLPLQLRNLDNPAHCDICLKKRSGNNHRKCSKIRQARHAAKAGG